jgi:regulator of RNase E activity RraA
MVNFTNDKEMFEIMRSKLTTAAIADTLDDLGAREQTMNPSIRPLYLEAVLAGRAYTVLFSDIFESKKNSNQKPVQEDIDLLKPDEVLVGATGGTTRYCMAGEMFCIAARNQGAAGFVFDSPMRDRVPIIKMQFPVFVAGTSPADIRSRCTAVDRGCPVNCGGVIVKPGDIVFGDYDGVVVIPQELEKETISLALQKLETEVPMIEELQKGAKLVDIIDKYDTL